MNERSDRRVSGEAGGFMLRALALAREVQGRTSPKPAVGAVLVKDGSIVGEGATEKPGERHAEIVALQAAGGTGCVFTAFCCGLRMAMERGGRNTPGVFSAADKPPGVFRPLP